MPLKARRDVGCTVCGELIHEGTEVTPLINSEAKALLWAHLTCVTAEDERIPVCKHWRTKGMCIFRETCQFRHPPEECKGSDRLRQRYGTWARYRIYNEGRAGALRRWLMDIFGTEYLNSGSGVLDVAGGKGELSFELNNLSNIRSTVVDPRPLEISRYRKKLHYGFYHSNQILGTYNTRPNPADFDKHIIPAHLRIFFEVETIESWKARKATTECETAETMLPNALSGTENFLEESRRAINTAWTAKGLVHEDDDGADEEAEEEPAPSEASYRSSCVFNEAEDNVILDYEEALNIMNNCSVLIGMHPDQAAGHIVDFALQSGKPFAIVPCCVYHRQFPNRKLPNGQQVKKYAELIEFLMAKDPSIRALEMDFEGKNILLYYLGGDQHMLKDENLKYGVPLRDPSERKDLMCRGEAGPEQWWGLSSTKHPLHCRCKDDGDEADPSAFANGSTDK